ncbi:cutinase transcription factor 1 beta [Fusarium acutatum]|uniref:Cutinase transcription factor 1 beta n=1 Tax=Fusarium acutatum TaxID=78861 RepID=A0A8H4NRH3_9HYPO|nr:cutinase transcription factor 1 beta [Fusarium acutatum]
MQELETPKSAPARRRASKACQASLLLETLSDPTSESPSTCFENVEELTPTEAAADVNQQSIPPGQGHLDIGAYQASDSTKSRHNAGDKTRSHITYSYYPFLALDMSGLEPSDVHYLESQMCLSVPTPDALDDFIREYFLHVHPGLPLLDEADFWAVYSGNKEPCGEPTISLFLFQAMLFAASSFVPFSTLKCLGFTSRHKAGEKYYRRAKLLLDICSSKDTASNAQGALLLSYYVTSRDRARNNSILLATAIQLAQGAGADHFHKRPDQDSATTNRLKRLWWCCIVRDRILPLGVRRQLHIASVNPTLEHLTEDDFEREIQGSQVYSLKTKRSLVQLFISLCELAIPFASVVQTVYGMGFSAVDAISPIMENRKQIEESIKFCEISLDAWFDKAAIQFPTPAGIISPEKSLVLYTNLMYIYYHSARVALYQYEAFVVSLSSPGASMDDKLHQTRLQLEDAILGITDNLKELVQLKVARFLPISIIAYAALPLMLHVLDVKLAKLPSQTARKQGRLNIYIEAMKGLQNLYDGVDVVWTFIRGAIDSATSQILNTADSSYNSAICPKESISFQAADNWGSFLSQEPILYFRLSRTIDLSLAVGSYSEDSSLSLLLATAQFSSPNLVLIGVDALSESQTSPFGCDKASIEEERKTEIDDVCAVRSDMFDEIGNLDESDLGMDHFHIPEFLDIFEMDLEDGLNSER